MKREISFRRPIEEPSPLLDSAESVGEGVCDHILGLADDDGDLFEMVSSLSGDYEIKEKYNYCRDCGEKL